MDRQTCLFRFTNRLSARSRTPLCLIAATVIALQAAIFPNCAVASGDGSYKAGIASTVITPDKPMWMSGFAARTKPSEGKIHDLHAKVLAIEDAGGVGIFVGSTTELDNGSNPANILAMIDAARGYR